MAFILRSEDATQCLTHAGLQPIGQETPLQFTDARDAYRNATGVYAGLVVDVANCHD